MSEEDIKILEQYIKSSFRLTLPENVLQAIEHLIKAYKELEEENIYWRGQYHLLSRKINVIPVSLVEEKIEELKNKIKYENAEKVIIWLHKQIRILQELLEKRK